MFIVHYGFEDVGALKGWSHSVRVASCDTLEQAERILIHPWKATLRVLAEKPYLFLVIAERQETGRVVGYGSLVKRRYCAVTATRLWIDGKQPANEALRGLDTDLVAAFKGKTRPLFQAIGRSATLSTHQFSELGVRLLNLVPEEFQKHPDTEKAYQEILKYLQGIGSLQSLASGLGIRRSGDLIYLAGCNLSDAVQALLNLQLYTRDLFGEMIDLFSNVVEILKVQHRDAEAFAVLREYVNLSEIALGLRIHKIEF